MEEHDGPIDEDSPEQIAAKLRGLFRDEAYELIAELESALLAIEKTPEDKEEINRVFRALHTIKGSGAACGLTDIAHFTHDIETAFDLVRKGNVTLNKELIDLTLAARDHIKAMFDACYQGGEADEAQGTEIIAAIRNCLAVSGGGTKDAPAKNAPSKKDTPGLQEEKNYRIRFHPGGAMTGTDPSELLHELGLLGTCAVVAQMDAMASATGTPSWEVLLVTRWGIEAIQDVFILARDQWEMSIEVSDGQADRKNDKPATVRNGSQANNSGNPSTCSERSEVKGSGASAAGTDAMTASPQGQDSGNGKLHAERLSSIRVPTDKLDRLVDLVGELVTMQARLNQTALSKGITEFLSIAEELERLTGDLRDEAMGIRMMPIGTTFSRFKRLVRDLCQELGKEVVLVTEGAETELDKTVIERLGDPLVHLIRNSMDHGIEPPADRVKAGKPAAGTLVISAAHSGSHVLIQVRDDGTGFSLEQIRAKGIERGLLREGERYSEKDLLELIFLPGFSTAKTITNVSGRGVGLDVVKRSIDSLGGTIMIRNNEGVGATIVLKLPLTLAIIDGFLTEVGQERYVFPLSLVEECVELAGVSESDRHLINVRGSLVPYVRLREQFIVPGGAPVIEQIVIARVDEKRVGFVVDRVIGGHQTVIKDLGSLYRNVEGLSGATILGDGTVALILDVPKLVSIAERVETSALNANGLFAP